MDSGCCVILNEILINSKDKVRYLVTPYYEGDAMTCALYPSGHTEIEVPFEIEGEPIIVNELFNKEPLNKIGEKYKKLSEDITALSIANGNLCKENKKLEELNKTLNYEIKTKTDSKDKAEKEKVLALINLTDIKDKVRENRQRNNELEATFSELEQTERTTTINKDELLQLKKDSYLLQCLEAGGVDSWEWYDEARTEYDKQYSY